MKYAISKKGEIVVSNGNIALQGRSPAIADKVIKTVPRSPAQLIVK